MQNDFESELYKNGILYINSNKKQLEPIGNNQFKVNYRSLGGTNEINQYYITRNCFFEPSSDHDRDWVGECLKQISIAFFWNKPAIISTHRVNYIGFLNKTNRERSLRLLSTLIKRMLEEWPEIEFITTQELGGIIRKEKNLQE